MNANDIIEKCAEIADKWARDLESAGNQFDHEGDIYRVAGVAQQIANTILALKSSLPAETVSEAMVENGQKDAMNTARNLALLCNRLCRRVSKFNPNDDLVKIAGEYLNKTGLLSVFRGGDAAALAHADDGWRAEDMPPPDRVIHYNDGMSAPAMFHYSTENCDARTIAHEAGFEIAFVTMERELGDDHPLMKAYVDDGEMSSVLNRWKPVVPDGWKFGGKTDSEDGPVALLLRPLPAPPKDGRE